LPYILTVIILVVLAIHVILNKRKRKLIFTHKNSQAMILPFAFLLIIPCLYGNWLGVAVGIAIILVTILGLFLRSIMTHVLYEKALTLICVLSLTSTSCAISEKFIIPIFNDSFSTRRITAMFFHPNYFGTVIGTVIIICAYKILTKQGKASLYYVIAFMNVISMYLCESMFAWVEVFFGVAVLLVTLKKSRLFAIWLLAAGLASFIIFRLNINIIPRLSDVQVTTMLRLKIWKLAIVQIKDSMFFGHGFMSYLFVNKNNLTPHSHSIYLEMILNFGIAGTIIFLRLFIQYYKIVIKVCFKEKNTLITTLIISLTVAALVHGVADITLMWVQTLPLFMIVLSGIGAYEKHDKAVAKN